MAASAVMARILVLMVLLFCVRKPLFVNANSVCYSLLNWDSTDVHCLHIYSSLWVCGVHRSCCLRSKYLWITLVLLLCGDIEINPGPTDRNIPEISEITQTRGINFFHLNIRGLWTNFSHFSEIVENNKNIDVFALSETHISDEPGDMYNIDDYTFVTRHRKTGPGGGVAFYISQRLKWNRRKDLENETESIWIEIFPEKSKSYLISAIYRPPDNSKYLPYVNNGFKPS